MKSARAYAIAHTAPARHAGGAALSGAAQRDGTDSVPYRLQQAVTELGELKRALATS